MLFSFHCIITKIIIYHLPQVCLGGHFNFLTQKCYFCIVGICMATKKGYKVRQDDITEKLLVMTISSNCSPECDAAAAAAAAKSLQSCPTVRPHRRQPTRLPRSWDSPGKNTGVGCHFLLQCMKVKSEREVAQLCLTLRAPMDCSLAGSSIHGLPLPSLPECDG